MHAIEREIIKITKYKVQRKFDDRQDYLRSVLLAVQNLDDSKFDELSDEAAEWANACVEIENGKRGADLPDFDEVEAEDEPDEVVENDEDEEDSDDGNGSSENEDESDGSDDEDSDDEADETSEDEASDINDEAEDSEAELDDDPDDDPDDDEAEAESDDDEDLEDEDDPPTAEDGPDVSDDDEDFDEGPAPKPLKKAAAGKASKTDLKGKPAAKKAKAPKVPPKEEKIPNPPRRPRPEPGNDIELDKWGCMIGSKNSKALALFENGATSGEIKRELGGTYYNVLKKMIEQGHRLEKYGAITKLIHRDELAPKKPKKK